MTGILLALVTVIFFPGLVVKTKSLASGRIGPGIMQPWKNIEVLIRKKSVISRTTSALFGLAPLVYLVSVLGALLLVPFAGLPSFLGFRGDFIVFAYLLATGKFFFILGAMDTGSSFEGMGANREALYSLLAEPALFILFGTLGMLTGHNSMQEIFTNFQWTDPYPLIIGIITVYLLVQIAMVENSRMPVDDPRTHLELTMVHEVMILDYSGIDLAIIQVATQLKFALYGTLIAECILPSVGAPIVRFPLYFAIQALFAVTIGLLESFRARRKMMKNPQFILTLGSIALVAFILVLLLRFNVIDI